MVKQGINKFSYGALFTIIIPGYLWWLSQTINLGLPSYHWPYTGLILTITGGGLMFAAMADLFLKGKGLPMNAFPPQNLVRDGAYAIVAHPIYTGFNMIVAGLALYFGSATALWLILPLTIAGCLSLVWGYERIYLLKSFNELPSSWLAPPVKETLFARLGSFLALFVSWLIIYQAFILVGAPADAVNLHFAFEQTVPVLVLSYPIYASAYLFVLLPFLFCSLPDLKRFFSIGWLSIAIMVLCYMVIPVISEPRPLPQLSETASIFYQFCYQALAYEMQYAAPFTASFPSYHVVWSVLVAITLARINRVWAIGSSIWAGLIILSCFTTGMHALWDLIAGMTVAVLLSKMSSIWNWMIRTGNTYANSYHFRIIGPIRIMSHVKYSFITGFVLILLSSWLLGASVAKYIVALGCLGLLGAVLWGWLVEGSAVSMRPLGYFGSVLLLIIVSAALLANGHSPWLFVAALFCCAPAAQVVGRFRCIIQGCCHGREIHTHQTQGFCVSAPRSRVVSLSNLQHKLIYPTQLYSILGNVALGLLLFRLWTLQVNISLIIGLYLVFTGYLRFIEEGYRGEIQTPQYYSLTSYQWLCILFIILGTLVMVLDLGVTPQLNLITRGEIVTILFWASLGGVIGGCVGSIDFPNSNLPFSRLER